MVQRVAYGALLSEAPLAGAERAQKWRQSALRGAAALLSAAALVCLLTMQSADSDVPRSEELMSRQTSLAEVAQAAMKATIEPAKGEISATEGDTESVKIAAPPKLHKAASGLVKNAKPVKASTNAERLRKATASGLCGPGEAVGGPISVRCWLAKHKDPDSVKRFMAQHKAFSTGKWYANHKDFGKTEWFRKHGISNIDMAEHGRLEVLSLVDSMLSENNTHCGMECWLSQFRDPEDVEDWFQAHKDYGNTSVAEWYENHKGYMPSTDEWYEAHKNYGNISVSRWYAAHRDYLPNAEEWYQQHKDYLPNAEEWYQQHKDYGVDTDDWYATHKNYGNISVSRWYNEHKDYLPNAEEWYQGHKDYGVDTDEWYASHKNYGNISVARWYNEHKDYLPSAEDWYQAHKDYLPDAEKWYQEHKNTLMMAQWNKKHKIDKQDFVRDLKGVILWEMWATLTHFEKRQSSRHMVPTRKATKLQEVNGSGYGDFDLSAWLDSQEDFDVSAWLDSQNESTNIQDFLDAQPEFDLQGYLDANKGNFSLQHYLDSQPKFDLQAFLDANPSFDMHSWLKNQSDFDMHEWLDSHPDFNIHEWLAEQKSNFSLSEFLNKQEKFDLQAFLDAQPEFDLHAWLKNQSDADMHAWLDSHPDFDLDAWLQEKKNETSYDLDNYLDSQPEFDLDAWLDAQSDFNLAAWLAGKDASAASPAAGEGEGSAEDGPAEAVKGRVGFFSRLFQVLQGNGTAPGEGGGKFSLSKWLEANKSNFNLTSWLRQQPGFNLSHWLKSQPEGLETEKYLADHDMHFNLSAWLASQNTGRGVTREWWANLGKDVAPAGSNGWKRLVPEKEAENMTAEGMCCCGFACEDVSFDCCGPWYPAEKAEAKPKLSSIHAQTLAGLKARKQNSQKAKSASVNKATKSIRFNIQSSLVSTKKIHPHSSKLALPSKGGEPVSKPAITSMLEWGCEDSCASTPLRVGPTCEVECLSNDGINCLKGGDCGAMTQDAAEDSKSVVCGAAHKAAWGTTGYDDPSHWCSCGKTQLKEQITSCLAAGGGDAGNSNGGSVFGSGLSFGDGINFANGDKFGDDNTFGKGDTFGDHEVFGSGNKFEDAKFGLSSKFSDKNSFEGGSEFGDSPTFGSENTFGEGSVFGKDAKFGDKNELGENAVLGEKSSFGQGNSIGEGASVGKGAQLGADTTVGDNAALGQGVKLGANTKVGDGVAFGSEAAKSAKGKAEGSEEEGGEGGGSGIEGYYRPDPGSPFARKGNSHIKMRLDGNNHWPVPVYVEEGGADEMEGSGSGEAEGAEAQGAEAEGAGAAGAEA